MRKLTWDVPLLTRSTGLGFFITGQSTRVHFGVLGRRTRHPTQRGDRHSNSHSHPHPFPPFITQTKYWANQKNWRGLYSPGNSWHTYGWGLLVVCAKPSDFQPSTTKTTPQQKMVQIYPRIRPANCNALLYRIPDCFLCSDACSWKGSLLKLVTFFHFNMG